MVLTRIALVVLFLAVLTGCGTGTMILWNPRTGQCDEVPKAAAYALGGGLFAATKDVDAWRCEGLEDGDLARTVKPKA
jgi:hypothetical protein